MVFGLWGEYSWAGFEGVSVCGLSGGVGAVAVGGWLVGLLAPFPWWGGKRRVAARVWERFGNPGVYVEPFEARWNQVDMPSGYRMDRWLAAAPGRRLTYEQLTA